MKKLIAAIVCTAPLVLAPVAYAQNSGTSSQADETGSSPPGDGAISGGSTGAGSYSGTKANQGKSSSQTSKRSPDESLSEKRTDPVEKGENGSRGTDENRTKSSKSRQNDAFPASKHTQ